MTRADFSSAGAVPHEKQRVREARIRNIPPYAPLQAVAERDYHLLGGCFRVRFGRLDQVPRVDSVLGHLVRDERHAPAATFEIHGLQTRGGAIRSFVYRDGKAVDVATGLHRLGPIVKAAFLEAAVNAHDFRFYIHAGVVATGKSCILLPAASGSGKSSLTAALIHRGFRYFSDEVALVEPGTLRVSPVPLALCVKQTGWDLIGRYYPQVFHAPAHERNDRKIVRYLSPSTIGLPIEQESVPVSHIIFPAYQSGARTELVGISRAEALRRLMNECPALRQGLDRGNVTELIDWLRSIHCFEMRFSSLDEACDLVMNATK